MGTNDYREIRAKLQSLQKDFERNEARMRKAAIDYEDLVAQKDDAPPPALQVETSACSEPG